MFRSPQPVSESRPTAQAGQPVAGLASVAERSSSHSSWAGVSAGSTPSRSAAAAVTWGAEKEVPIAFWNSEGPQFEYGTRRSRDRRVDEVARDGREDRAAGRRDVGVLRVAVRVVGDVSVLADRGDAEHVRKRSRVVGVVPGCRRRLRAVADRRDDEDALRVRVLERGLLAGREGVELGVARIADPADGEVDHAGTVSDRPVDRLDLAGGETLLSARRPSRSAGAR